MKKINAKVYTDGRIAHRPLRYVSDPDGYLFSHARYPTKILATDLPEWFIPCYIYKSSGYLSAKGVKQMAYKPNYSFTNHLYKDDLLFISYDKPLVPTVTSLGFKWFEGYDHIISGACICRYIEAVEKYSALDVSELRTELQRKCQWYIDNNPPEERYEL